MEKIVVRNGSVRIFNNKRLCPSEVQTFVKMLERVEIENHPEWTSHDVISINGKFRHCADATIELNHYVVDHETVTIRWRDYDPEKHEHYLAFEVRYIAVNETYSHDKVFELHPLDSCSPFGWEHVYIALKDLEVNNEGFFEVNITGLAQLTTYEYAIKVYHNNVEDPSIRAKLDLDPNMDGASSVTKRFRTDMNIPSRVQALIASEIMKESVKLKWMILENEADGINFFFIDVELLPLNITQIDDRDYCSYPPMMYEGRLPLKIAKIDDRDNCSYHPELNKQPESHDDFLERNYGNEFAANKEECCRKCCPHLKNRTSSARAVSPLAKGIRRLADSGDRIYTGMNHRPHLLRLRYNSTEREALIGGLSPFTQYRFYIYACASESKCSGYEILTLFTNIDTSLEKVELQVGGNYVDGEFFFVEFNEPPGNGPIVSYNVDILQLEDNMTIYNCVNRKNHEKRGFR